MYLAENFDKLPKSELRRIQKLLKVILQHNASRESLKKNPAVLFKNMGRPTEILQNMSEFSRLTFFRLIDSFGVLTLEQLTEAEKEALQANPFTIWPSDTTCVVSGEALNLFSNVPEIRKGGYLFSYLGSLSAQEKRAWSGWLGLSNQIRSEKERTQKLYAYLARIRCNNPASKASPAAGQLHPMAAEYDICGDAHSLLAEVSYLDQVFEDNPARNPVAWFYRGVLPLYHSLEDAEKKWESLSSLERRLLLSLKSGQLIIQKESPNFGEKERYKLKETREVAHKNLPHRPGFRFMRKSLPWKTIYFSCLILFILPGFTDLTLLSGSPHIQSSLQFRVLNRENISVIFCIKFGAGRIILYLWPPMVRIITPFDPAVTPCITICGKPAFCFKEMKKLHRYLRSGSNLGLRLNGSYIIKIHFYNKKVLITESNSRSQGSRGNPGGGR